MALVTLRPFAGGGSAGDVPLLIDTGADITLLPRSAVATIGLTPQPGTQYELIGFDGMRSTADAVDLDMLFLGKAFRGRYLLTDDNHGVIGRATSWPPSKCCSMGRDKRGRNRSRLRKIVNKRSCYHKANRAPLRVAAKPWVQSQPSSGSRAVPPACPVRRKSVQPFDRCRCPRRRRRPRRAFDRRRRPRLTRRSDSEVATAVPSRHVASTAAFIYGHRRRREPVICRPAT